MIAEIIINSNVKNLNRIFDYNIPEELQSEAKIGSRVFVKFGNMKKLEEGYIVGIKQKTEYKVKNIDKIEESNVIGENEINLSKWMSKNYFCNISDCIKLMLPPGTTSKNVDNRAKEKNVSFVKLVETTNIEDIIEKLKSEKQKRTLKFLKESGEIQLTDLELLADTTRSVIKTLEKNGYVEIYEKKVERNPFIHKRVEKSENLKFTEEQKVAYEEIEEAMDMAMYSEFLLFGVTRITEKQKCI